MFTLQPIATVKNDRLVVEDDQWGEVVSTIKFHPSINPVALEGISSFSHLEIIFCFHLVEDRHVQWEARHPRNNKEYPKVGIFAQRGKNRPNKLGVTTVKLLEHSSADELIVKGLDAINGTPIIDIKPVMKEFLPFENVTQPEWVSDLMGRYWK
ncbi:SAM-dependent methyltransferase [Shouchella patagoniensis]|uniref:SAM-dependent methyltransferase n=1 Tax=Shouchella patagoniensis TaxID=228576 RepID=UPI000995376A|nr:SAM-dependent methyltransferase [Shouchella patagoniensis]